MASTKVSDLTWRDVLKFASLLSEEQLSMSATVYDKSEDEFYDAHKLKITGTGIIGEHAEFPSDDQEAISVIGELQPYLVIK